VGNEKETPEDAPGVEVIRYTRKKKKEDHVIIKKKSEKDGLALCWEENSLSDKRGKRGKSKQKRRRGRENQKTKARINVSSCTKKRRNTEKKARTEEKG